MVKWIFLVCGLLSIGDLLNPNPTNWNFDKQLDKYFRMRVEEIEEHNDLSKIDLGHFTALQESGREELLDMLGLSPLPQKSPLNVQVTSIVEHEFFTVENIVFESMPGLYVTANLYRPKEVTEKLPAVLYVCGHATVIKDGYNYGAKANYQHHPAWYARNGYICLILDTVQLGEIEGIHHGLYRYNRWWWESRGYTPAGVEAWNGIRAIDYLTTRSDVNPDKIGMTGRSGGGITSWWVAALDERIKVVAPISGITDLHNYVVDGCVEGHCDCMFFANTYQWDYPKLGFLIAPRPLLIGNADQDAIFPLDGVYRTYKQMKTIYDRLEASDQIAINVVGGGHHDIQDIQIPTFRWLNHFLQNDDRLIDLAAVKYLNPEQLRVLDRIPADERNTHIDSEFVSVAGIADLPKTTASLSEWHDQLISMLTDRVFQAWPKESSFKLGKFRDYDSNQNTLTMYKLETQPNIELPLLILKDKQNVLADPVIKILDDKEWEDLQSYLNQNFGADELWMTSGIVNPEIQKDLQKHGMIIYLPIRGAGIAKYSFGSNAMTHVLRRYYLLGETLESAQTYDILQGLKVIRELFPKVTHLQGAGKTSILATYASIFLEGYNIFLQDPSATHDEGPYYLGVRKYLDIPQALLLASMQNHLKINSNDTRLLSWFKELPKLKEFHLSF